MILLTIYLVGVLVAMLLFGFTTAYGARQEGDDPVEAILEVLDDAPKPFFTTLLWPMVVMHFLVLLIFRLKDTAKQVPPGDDYREAEEEANRIWKGR